MADTKAKFGTKMDNIEQLAREASAARDLLHTRAMATQALIDQVKAAHAKSLSVHARDLADLFDRLHQAVEDAPELFRKPKTIVLHGIKVGYSKGKGVIEYASDDTLISKIHKHCPEQADTLIRTKESPVKAALNNLDAALLRKLGVTITQTGDQVVVRPVDGEIDKLIAALINSDPEDTEGAAA
jgi:arsenate reductase-like glutaredoxin family protein